MEVATATPSNGNVPPFHDHDVREWSTLDSLTGVLERARIETDHWASNTNNSSHKYGKVVDSRARSDADGALRQQARRQLEVFQSQVPGGQLQVIKTHSVSSSRWTNKRAEDAIGGVGEFEGLQIPSNPLDLSFQKSKAVIGRSAARRPPSRIKIKEDTSPSRQLNPFDVSSSAASSNLQRVTRLCHQIHENAVKQAFGKYSNRSSISERLNLSKSNEEEEKYNPINNRTLEIAYSNGHTNLSRTKSSSSEDFLINLQKDKSTKSTEDLEDLEQLQTWRRSSKIRRSLQHPKQDRPTPNKPVDLPESSISVRKITEDFEKGRRLSTALRGNSIDLQALDQILQSISSSGSDKTSIADEDVENTRTEVSKSKRNSFVTVESLQEIKGRLRRTSSPEKHICKNVEEHEIDDGIVTEENILKNEEKMIELNKSSASQSRVRSYVYGMESVLNKKPVTGTGSLESRSKLLSGTTNRSEDWYNRRKSYGFEPVQDQNESMSSKKNIVESSTDSGICRSNEVIVVPSVIKNHNTEDYNSDINNIRTRLGNVELNKDCSFGNVRKISSLFDSGASKSNSFAIRRDLDSNQSWNKRMNKENDWSLNSGVTIKIPIVPNNHWNEEPEKEIKRHSIAVDETKYVSQNQRNNEARRTSLVINEKFLNAPIMFENGDNDFSPFNKKSKKVEFCKTEVHFAAESGKVNIVETDEKPPPTQNFRRRRRNTNSLNYLNDFNKNGLPVLHFGENYIEKTLFTNGNQQYSEESNSAEDSDGYSNSRPSVSHGVVTVNSDYNNFGMFDDDKRELSENESIKGILKNKIIKPKPYHLGENPLSFNTFDDESYSLNSNKLLNRDPPLWKSTVTVSSTLFDNKVRNGDENASILKTLDPNNQPDLIKDQLKRLTEYHSECRRAETTERVRPFLSVAERIRNMEESQKSDSHKGYSTRVNIGEGQAVVVENTALSKPDIYLDTSRKEVKENKAFDQSGAIGHFEEPVRIKAEIKNRKYSPIVLRKHPMVVKTAGLKSANASENLSSPILVGRSSNDNKLEDNLEKSTKTFENETIRKESQTRTTYETKTVENNSKNTFVKNDKVLRQPKKSELAYFGVKLPQEYNNKIDTSTTEIKPSSNSANKNMHFGKETTSSTKSKNKTKNYAAQKDGEISHSPIYENISPVSIKTESKPTKEFDSCILEELTKAADEILQAVKDYSEEESRKRKEEEESKIELTTITENKSWKHQEKVNRPVDRPCKSKLGNTSSNSSMESTPKDSKSTQRYISSTKASADKIKTKTTSSESSGLKATTKARRLQRASSREALLQSHGSSSEDLAVNEVPLRKPRLVRKTKTTQLTVSNVVEVSKKTTVSASAKRKTEVNTKPKPEERLPGALPEIRHKTAISTIKSTAEKANRDKVKHRAEDNKKKQTKDFAKVSPSSVSPMRSKRETVTHRLATANIKKYRPEKH